MSVSISFLICLSWFPSIFLVLVLSDLYSPAALCWRAVLLYSCVTVCLSQSCKFLLKGCSFPCYMYMPTDEVGRGVCKSQDMVGWLVCWLVFDRKFVEQTTSKVFFTESDCSETWLTRSTPSRYVPDTLQLGSQFSGLECTLALMFVCWDINHLWGQSYCNEGF